MIRLARMLVVALATTATLGAPAPAPSPAAPGEEGRMAGPTPAAIVEIPLRPAFVLREAGAVPLDAEPPHPGEVVGLVLEWAEGGRVPVELVAPGVDTGQAVPLKLIRQDPRVDGDDVIEVLLLGLGEVEVPPILLRAEDGATLETEPVAFELTATLGEDDTEPAPARGQAAIGLNAWGIALWAGLALALVAGLLAFLRFRRREEGVAPGAPAEPELPPEAWAHAALDELLESNLLAEGRMKEFHVRLAEISKEYLSRRFHVHLMEHTTFECPGILREAGVDAEICRETADWLSHIDLVKFAGERPPSQQVVASVQALRNMVERTAPKVSAPEIAAAAEATDGGPAAGAGA